MVDIAQVSAGSFDIFHAVDVVVSNRVSETWRQHFEVPIVC